MSFIESLLQYQFLSRALITAIIVGIVSGVVGSLIILRSLSLMGDAMSHAVLPGVAISFLLNIPMFIGALISGLLTSILISAITHQSKTKNDAAIGITFTAFFSLGVILISLIKSPNDLYHMLFGNILTVTSADFYMTLIVSMFVLIFIIICFKPLQMTSFDSVFSHMSGLNTTFWHYAVMIMLALVTVVSLQTVGIILVVAMLITPASSAYLLTKSLKSMMILSSIFGTLSATVGIYLSFIYNLPSGACIVLIAFFIYITIFIFNLIITRKEAHS